MIASAVQKFAARGVDGATEGLVLAQHQTDRPREGKLRFGHDVGEGASLESRMVSDPPM